MGIFVGPLVESPALEPAFRGLFLHLYGCSEPVLELGSMLHWKATVEALGLGDLAIQREPALVLGGYGYNTSTAVPSADALEGALELARARGLHVLIPTVRDRCDTAVLLRRGFVPVPAFVESILDAPGDLEQQLRATLGTKRYREIQRLTRRADEAYPATVYRAPELRADPSLLTTAAALHACNVRKYAHARNFYSEAILSALLGSALGELLLVIIRRGLEGEPVQASISLLDEDRRQLYQLVQGIDAERVAPGQNLYIADTYAQFQLGAARRVVEHNLGRGAPAEKRRLGATRFETQSHWIWPCHARARAELARLAPQEIA
jgi:hypothetical protein